jgi:hypothetical protein
MKTTPIFLATLLVATLALASRAGAQKARVSGSTETYESRPFLRWERPTYQNYAIDHFQNYDNHVFPYDDSRRTIYGPMGDYLVSGYDLYSWEENRTPGQVYGSAIFKPNEMYSLPWEKVYNSTAVAKDGYGNWGFSLLVADNMIARLSPLTLSMVDFNGFRFDLALPIFKGTVLASRVERPHTYQETPTIWAIEKTHFADDSTLLMGGRLQADLGVGTLGFNMVNSHVYRSTQDNNDRRGVIRPDHPLFEWLIVRFSDDSPDDGIAGAHFQDVTLILNGEARPDIVPLVVSNPGGIRPQVGTFSSATGRFRATNYTLFSGARRYYRGRDELPLFSDYMVRRDHELGEDVSGAANLTGLLANFHIESPAGPLEANGDREIAFLYDLAQEGTIESVQIEALMGNDYKVDVANLYEVNTRGKTYHSRYNTTFYETVARARDNVQDLSNLKPVRFQVGEDTGIFVYSADLNLTLPGLEVTGEFARSAVHARYPSRLDGVSDFGAGPRFSTQDNAYFVNATHWFKRGRVGAEAFSINPNFTTTYRTFLDEENFGHTNLLGMINETIYWDLVEDNDDADRLPDRRMGNIVGFTNDSQDYDLDGVHLAQDGDNDGFPDTNRDGDGIPDYEEPFLMYDVEPNIYFYGLDRNNNDEPDVREDDGQVDYPYDPDQRGGHLFAQFDLTHQLSVAAGHYAVNEIAGPGRNKSTYALVTLDVRGVAERPLFFAENNFRRVQDDVRDEYLIIDETPIRSLEFSFRGLTQSMCTNCSGNNAAAGLHDRPPLFTSQFVPDVRSYQDSWVNETYMDLRLNPLSTFKWHQKLRARFNWQQGGELYNKTFQKQRRLDFWTSVTRLEFTKYWGKLGITPQYKYMFLSLRDQERGSDLISEIRSIPILRIEYPLMSRTSLRAGFQGLGPFPYRLKDDTADRNSYEQRTAFVTITNRSGYFGYELVTILGINKDQRKYDTKFRDIRDFDSFSLFVRGLVGFSEFGRPI